MNNHVDGTLYEYRDGEFQKIDFPELGRGASAPAEGGVMLAVDKDGSMDYLYGSNVYRFYEGETYKLTKDGSLYHKGDFHSIEGIY